ncbi:30S ribosomal protein S9 [Candidatus Gottesmanbacteria bacterium RBG_13_37_7]|uniref:30S ribosomal protein S9 n=1 Tax=Candidatus Gottesmanbacteria bacterium RBG_13_37_7 TaxID=1798369 RepID=A0A1F5YIY9_9BACT|nr:MAG: 30S ribosomal protein S9 [Candidatus Gottesmanbacteria bacterium RBG_13_37_7]
MPKKTKLIKSEKPIKESIKTSKKYTFYQAIGRRKEATARIRLYIIQEGEIVLKNKAIKKGDILVNYRSIEDYFPGEVYKKSYLEPFRTTNTYGRFAVSALLEGGGLSGQLGAFIHGVSRALEKVDKDKYRLILKKKGFLTRDSRAKERRKAGFAQKARAKKQSPKR